MMTTHDRAEIIRALTVFLQPGQVTEMRALDASKPPDRWVSTWSGYFDDPQRLADAVLPLTARGLYFVPNEVNPDLLARAANRARAIKGDPTTADGDITRRRWLLVDCDPVRASGISSSAVEHEQAIERAAEIQGWLESQGWPAPALADSGNGGHVLARVDLAADDGGLVERCLQALATRFSDSAVKVDTSVYNPARIWKLYGTMARKGDDTPGRPHRLARLLELPAAGVVTLEQLTALGGTAPQAGRAPAAMPRGGTGQALDVEQWAAAHGLELPAAKDWQGGRKWVLPVCPMNPDHTDRGAFIAQMPGGAIAAGCHHESCKGWGWAELRAKYEPARVAPRGSSAPPARVLTDADAPPAGGDNIESLIGRIKESTNGERPAALRALGDTLARFDTADWIDQRRHLVSQLGLKVSEVDNLRNDGLRRADEAQRAQSALAAAEAHEPTAPYFVRDGIAGGVFLMWNRPTADGPVPTRIADFAVKVVAERVRHRADGSSTRVLICELATARGPCQFEVLPETIADARAFYAACVNVGGADAKLANPSGAKHLPLAALELSDHARERSEIFEFVGWHKHNDRLIYLAAAGAIGSKEPLTVDLSNLAAGAGAPALANFGPRDDGDQAFETAKQALAGPVRDCLGAGVMLPQIAAVFLAPILRWAPIGELPVLHMMGATGKGKTRSAKILQAFYGMDRPAASWAWTQTSLEVVGAALRDCVVCIDDLKSSTCDPKIAVRTMQRWADRRPRVRSNRSGSGLVGSPHIGSLMLSNGENLPSGEASVASRSLLIPVWNETFNEDAFKQAEAVLDTLPTLMARYIAWLIDRQADLPGMIGEAFTEARQRYHAYIAGKTRISDAGRVASSCALLDTGASIMAGFLQAAGWTPTQAAAWAAGTRIALEDLALAQAGMIDEESVARRFLQSITALLDSHRVELQPVDNETDRACPRLVDCATKTATAILIGWHRGEEVLLDPNLTWSVVQTWLRQQGAAGLDKSEVYTQLRSGGYLLRWDKDQLTVPQRVGTGHQGKTQRVLALKAASLWPVEESEQLVTY